MLSSGFKQLAKGPCARHLAGVRGGIPSKIPRVPTRFDTRRTIASSLIRRAEASLEASAAGTSTNPLPKAGSGASSGKEGGSDAGPKQKKKGKKLRFFARTVLVLVLGATGSVVYLAHLARNPGEQLPFDPSLPTLVVLGNGWGSTSFLKNFDNEGYNVVVISPRNYFLFTPLLPSVTVGTLESRSIIEPTRFITRHMKRHVEFNEAEATELDPVNKTVTFCDNSEIKGAQSQTTIPYDYLVYAVGAENNTFGIPGVKEHGCFLKELGDADKIRSRVMDCVETATFEGQSKEEIKRLLHMVVVGGGPTGVEYAGELRDFLVDDLAHWYPEIANHVKITLVEALPNVLPMFSKQLIDYTTRQFAAEKIDVRTRMMVKKVDDTIITAQNAEKELVEIPYGLLVWATGNTTRPLTRSLIEKIGPDQNQRRGLVVDDHLRVLGAENVFALGDATATAYAATAQAANQQGRYLAKALVQMAKKRKLETALDEARHSNDPQVNEKIEGLTKQLKKASNIRQFTYSHEGSLAYIGSDKAIADLPFLNGNLASGGVATMLFWRSVYVSKLFSLRNRILVSMDWLKVMVFGRDVSRE